MDDWCTGESGVSRRMISDTGIFVQRECCGWLLAYVRPQNCYVRLRAIECRRGVRCGDDGAVIAVIDVRANRDWTMIADGRLEERWGAIAEA
jgi:hypothetical protein